MKTIALPLFVFSVLLGTEVLADGRPTGIRIGRVVSGAGTNVQIDITVPGTDSYYGDFSTDVWLGDILANRGYQNTWDARQYASATRNAPLPWAVSWGDSDYIGDVRLSGPPGGPFRGTFEHTYLVPGSYVITAGDALCCSGENTLTSTPIIDKGGLKGFIPPSVTTGNPITGSNRYVWTAWFTTTDTWYYADPAILAVTANATVTTGTGIPTTNRYGLIALALLLIGTGLLVFRRPQDPVT